MHSIRAFGIVVAASASIACAGESPFLPFTEVLVQVTATSSNDPATEPTEIKGRPAPRERPMDQAQYFSAAMDYRYPLTGDYESYYGARLFLEAYSTDHQGAGMTFGAGSLRLKPGSVPDRAAHDPILFDLGGFYRLYFTPPHVFLRPYGTVHLNVGTMVWRYKDDPVSDGEEVSLDSVTWADASIGVGLIVNLSKSCHLFGEMKYGGIGFLDTTNCDFKNELFDSFGYVKIETGLGWTF